MTTHAPGPRSQNQLPLPNQPFFSWVRTQTGLLTSQIIGLLSVVSVPIALFYYSKSSLTKTSIPGQASDPLHWQELQKVGQYVIYAHLLVLVLFIFFLIRRLHENNVGSYRAGLVHEKLKGPADERDELTAFSIRQVKRFKRRFLGFWCSMLCLYSVFAVAPLFSVGDTNRLQALTLKQMFRVEMIPILAFVLNNISLIFVFCCFSVLYLPRDASRTQPEVSLAIERGTGLIKRQWLRFYRLRYSLIKRFSKPEIDGRELRQRTLVVSFVVLVGVFTLTFPLIMITKNGVETNWSEYPAVFDALSGVLNAVVLALLVARLDSKLIGLPSWLICVLYFYAGVQPMFVVFELNPQEYAGIKTAVLWVVFIFKIYFFLIIFYSLQTGRLFNYFFCSKVLNELIEKLKAKPQPDSAPAATSAVTAEIEQTPRVRVVRDDPRELWFKRLGIAAIFFFAGSLIVYAALPDGPKIWVDQPVLSTILVVLNLIVLGIIGGFIYRARHREDSEFRPSNDSRSKVRSELLLELAGPESLEVRLSKLKDLSDRTDKQFKSFTKYFQLFWISLVFLYLAMLGSVWVKDRPTESPSNPAAAERVLQPNEAKVGSEQSSPVIVELKRFPVWELPAKTQLSFLFFVLNNFTVLILFLCFTVLYIPGDDRKFDEKHQLLRNSAVLIAVLFTVLIPALAVIIKGNGFTLVEAGKIPTILGAVGGTLNAVAFALLIARLDSRLIGLRLLLITVLYGYAALQPLFVTFNQPSNLLKFIATAAMIAVLVFKICLVLMVGHVRRSGGLIDYLWFFPRISASVNSIFDNQFEIKAYSPKPGSFSFSIFNKNVERYRASHIYPERDQCDLAIKTMVKAMEKRESYSEPAKKLQGTCWIQVKSDDLLICESVSLSSQTEADDLIDESIEKVPYCKYDRG
ncbi:MAG TPA: hypothetical protein VMS31_12215 [Pyrinomonadaceae bacterium]|nr:hypothetical protein [Pyrinomonadaceae bacterium]